MLGYMVIIVSAKKTSQNTLLKINKLGLIDKIWLASFVKFNAKKFK